METRVPHLRLKIPCNDEEDFHARLADHAAVRGLRVPTEARRPVGSRVTLVLEMRNGETLTCEGVVDAHVRMDGRSGVNVRVLRFAPGASGRARPRAAISAARDGSAALPSADEPLGDVPFADASEVVADEPPVVFGGDVLSADASQVAAGAPPAIFGSGTVSGDIVQTVNRRAARLQRAAIAVVAAALVVGAAGLAAARWLYPVGPRAECAAHVKAADRLLAKGRLTGKGGALEHLLAAKRLRPDDPVTNGRLSHVADLLEGLAARALQRGDLAVAEIHLAAAELAAPNRASIRAKREAIAKRRSADKSPAPLHRRTATAGTSR